MSKKRSGFTIPWWTFLYGLILVAYLYICYQPAIANFYNIPAEYLSLPVQWMAMAAFALLVLIDTLRLTQQQRRYDKRIQAYEEQLKALHSSKGKLQHKMHQYSDHADKLKMFISDRLLEHIQYDEKFLHFKNIASEVRHNGVISFDKVNAALRKAAATAEQPEKYQEAIQSMSYLWDLLDLSTTDNIAIYIANKLYESEEHYYQQQLSEEPSPFSPTFSLRHAVLATTRRFMGEDENLPPSIDEDAHYDYLGSRFAFTLDKVGDLLGNENYLILLIENLVNNALYYAEQKRYDSPHSRIVMALVADNGNAKLSVYNRGPHIEEETAKKLFQLGFSTKRVRENNGKGLGLYFINEIVKGYEGEINFENVITPVASYHIKVKLKNGDEVNNTVIVDLDDKQRPVCRDPADGSHRADTRFKFAGAVQSITVSSQQGIEAIELNVVGEEEQQFVDPQNQQRPLWQLVVKLYKATSHLVFTPQDITGVQFNVYLPTAESRLDSDYHDMDEGELDDIGSLDKGFEKSKEFLE